MNNIVEVTFFDTSLRDGAQSLPADHQFEEGAKPRVANSIADLGIGVIEAGFPATPGDSVEVKDVAESVGRQYYLTDCWLNGSPDGQMSEPPVIAGLSRTTPSDIEATWAAIQHATHPRIHTFISTDDEHMAAKFPDKSPDEVLSMGRSAVQLAKQLTHQHETASVEFSAEAASTTDSGYLEKVVKTALDEGADIINLPDTVGQRDPFWMEKFYSQALDWILSTNPDATLSAHNHNDLGMAVVNSLSLVKAAATHARRTDQRVRVQIEGTICGTGERAGNADLIVVAGGLYKFSDSYVSPISWPFNPYNAVSTATDVMGEAGFEVNRQNPVVGKDTNVHRSGIHSDGVIKGGHRIYTPHDPTFWGHARSSVHEEGKYQGKRGRIAAQQNG